MHINLEICLSQQYEMDRYDINMSDNDEQAILLIVCNQIALSNAIERYLLKQKITSRQTFQSNLFCVFH